MPRRIRKLIGTAATLGFVCVYAVMAMLVAQSDNVRHANGVFQAIFFCIVGMAWILPLMPLIRWMERPDRDSASAG